MGVCNKFLGFIILVVVIQEDLAKITIHNNHRFPNSNVIKDPLHFLRMVNVSLHFIPKLDAIAHPLHEVLKKGNDMDKIVQLEVHKTRKLIQNTN